MIPAGMAASGYFKHTSIAVFPQPSDQDAKDKFAIQNAKNEAYIKNLEDMKDQG